jgi:hypothetical protein
MEEGREVAVHARPETWSWLSCLVELSLLD